MKQFAVEPWNQEGKGNVLVADGAEGFWAEMSLDVSAQEALDAYLSTADYSAATSKFQVTATILAGDHKGDMATMIYDPKAVA